MGRLLLNSSQVGLVLSTTIIIAFTTALFLAGYVLQQNTVTHLREAIRPKGIVIHHDLYEPSSSSFAFDEHHVGNTGKTGGNAFPDVLDVEIRRTLEEGSLEPFANGRDGDGEVEEDDEMSDSVSEVLVGREGRPGVSEDEAGFKARRRADRIAAAAAAAAAAATRESMSQSEMITSQTDSVDVEQVHEGQPAVLHAKMKAKSQGPRLGSLYEEAKRMLRRMGRDDGVDDVEELLTVDPRELTSKQRRKVFLAQLASGQSPDAKAGTLWNYRRRTWLEG